MDVSDPVKLVRMIRDTLQAAGLDEATIAQVGTRRDKAELGGRL